MKDYLDLETEIMNLGQIESDLESLLYKVMDDPNPPTEDELSNLLIGIIAMHRVRFDKMFAVFEECVKNKKLFNRVTDSEGSVELH